MYHMCTCMHTCLSASAHTHAHTRFCHGSTQQQCLHAATNIEATVATLLYYNRQTSVYAKPNLLRRCSHCLLHPCRLTRHITGSAIAHACTADAPIAPRYTSGHAQNLLYYTASIKLCATGWRATMQHALHTFSDDTIASHRQSPQAPQCLLFVFSACTHVRFTPCPTELRAGVQRPQAPQTPPHALRACCGMLHLHLAPHSSAQH